MPISWKFSGSKHIKSITLDYQKIFKRCMSILIDRLVGKISCEGFIKKKNFPKYRRDYLLYNDRIIDVANLNVCMYFTIIELLEGNMESNFVKGIVTYVGPKI